MHLENTHMFYLSLPLLLLPHAVFTSDLRSASAPPQQPVKLFPEQKHRQARTGGLACGWRDGGARTEGEEGRHCPVIHVSGVGSESRWSCSDGICVRAADAPDNSLVAPPSASRFFRLVV